MINFLRSLFSFYLKYVFSDWSTRHREIVSVKNERDVGTIDRIRLYQANYTIELRVCWSIIDLFILQFRPIFIADLY